MQKKRTRIEKALPEEKARKLTEQERKLFGGFVQSLETRKQVVEMIDRISLSAYTGNVILTGDMETKTVELSKNVIKQLQMMEDSFSGKVAKIHANTLEQRDIRATFEKIKNGAIIIQKAGSLTQDGVVRLNRALNMGNDGLFVILTDTTKAMNRLICKLPAIEETFNARIDIIQIDNDALAIFGQDYAKEKEYVIDEMGMLALYTRISDIQTSTHSVDTKDVKDIIEEAIDSANRKTPKHFFDVVLKKRYDEEDMIILKEKDFLSY